jgi:hypothetical protein
MLNIAQFLSYFPTIVGFLFFSFLFFFPVIDHVCIVIECMLVGYACKHGYLPWVVLISVGWISSSYLTSVAHVGGPSLKRLRNCSSM